MSELFSSPVFPSIVGVVLIGVSAAGYRWHSRKNTATKTETMQAPVRTIAEELTASTQASKGSASSVGGPVHSLADSPVGEIATVGASKARSAKTSLLGLDRWQEASSAVEGFLDGDEDATNRFSTLLENEGTRQVVAETLSNIARVNPSAAAHLRGRDEDVAQIRQWVRAALEEADPALRARACEVVATLRLRACHGLVLAATLDDDQYVRQMSCKALAVLDPEAAVGTLLRLIDTDGAWAADQLTDLIQRLPATDTQGVLTRAREWSTVPSLVGLLSSSPTVTANELLLGAFSSEADPESRAQALIRLGTQPRQSVRDLAIDTATITHVPNSAIGRNNQFEQQLVREGLAAPSRVSVSSSDVDIAGGTARIDTQPLARIGSTQNASESASVATAPTSHPSTAGASTVTSVAPDSTVTSISPAAARSNAGVGLVTGNNTGNVASTKGLGTVEMWLVSYLTEQGGEASATAVKAAAAEADIAERTLERARPAIADSERRGFGQGALWRLRPEFAPAQA